MRKDRGFTLIELMVVITILGLLASITSVGVMKYLKSARISRAKMDMRAIVNAVKSYRLENNKIPAQLSDLCGTDEDERFLEMTEPPRDPWGNEYQYTPKDRKNYDLVCLGADGVDGGEGEDKDITVADLEDTGTAKDD